MQHKKSRGLAALALSVMLMATPTAIANATEPTDTTSPTITLKPETVLSNGRAKVASYKLHDAGKVDKVVINGVVKDLSNNVWSDLNGVKPGTFGAVEGLNTITLYDVAGNMATVKLTLDTTGPTITVKPAPDTNGSDGRYAKTSFKLNDGSKVDKVVLNGVVKDLSNNVWSDLNGVKPGTFGAVEGLNTLVVFDALGNSSEFSFVLDTKGPIVSIKDESVANGTGYSSISFKLNDSPAKIDKATINGVLKDLSNNVWSDLNGVKPGTFGAVEGLNTLVVFDTLGNCTTFEFTLDTSIPEEPVTEEPETPVVTNPEPEPTEDTPSTDKPEQETPIKEDTDTTTPVEEESNQDPKPTNNTDGISTIPASFVSNPVTETPTKTIAPLQLAATGMNVSAFALYAGTLLLAGIVLIVAATAAKRRARVEA